MRDDLRFLMRSWMQQIRRIKILCNFTIASYNNNNNNNTFYFQTSVKYIMSIEMMIYIQYVQMSKNTKYQINI